MKVLGLVVLVACGASRPEPLGNAGTPVVLFEPPPQLARMPRPAIDLSSVIPDPTEEARWPLSVTAHPAFEPRFNIAGALAQPGIGWIDLCQMGAQNRTLSTGRDLQAYLKAWCAAANGNTADAVDQLAHLGVPIVSGMAPAIREDLANLLVQHGDADAAEKLLAKAKIEDIEIFDLLAASYFEVGRTADAHEINERAIDRQFGLSIAAQCHRFARRVILTSSSSRAYYMRELDALGDELARTQKNLTTEPDCKELDAELSCWTSPATGCAVYLQSQHLDHVGYAHLLDVYYTWPTGEMSFGTWSDLARDAELARPLPQADRLETAAVLASFNSLHCMTSDTAAGLGVRLVMVRARALNVRDDPHHDPTLDTVLDELVAATIGYGPDPKLSKRKQQLDARRHCHTIALTVP